MKKLIMLSAFALVSAFSFASNEQGSAMFSQEQINLEWGCYQIVETTVYSTNYNITHSTQVETYKIFNSIAELNVYIDQLKASNPDVMYNGSGYKTFYSYTKTRIIKCGTISGPL